MKEQLITLLMSLFVGLFIILGIAGMTLFFIEAQNINSFRKTVSHTIERNGGLNDVLIAELNEHSKTFFNNRFTVQTQNTFVDFGELITYEIIADIPIPFLPIPNFRAVFTGVAASMTRKGA